MTYLDLLNRVLRRLREPQITSISGEKALFYGQLVNEVKSDIENAGPWFALRQNVTGTMTAHADAFTLAGTNQRSYVLFESADFSQAFVTTVDREVRMREVTWEQMDSFHVLNPDSAEGVPTTYAYRKSTAGIAVRVFPTPDLAYTYRFNCVIPQNDLSDPTDVLLIPYEPVWRESVVRAMEERGEEFNGSLEAARAKADEALIQAILDDWAREPMTFEAV